ncbi:ABC transporter permease [Pseudooceanicola sediminis]|uniref:ABC transporter permease n=1 Tax=Pseudooceanicola sediminis TaxID=2211117 RepID=A0A399IZN7_9RHOB|nr:ABC transporter permease [Pseudooceanicola sediminis]KAA2313819.1 ABC transporter permease [Puniceibacterium sp. HSS470]RII38638.1 ABC transporter permease [Pseudooceanicola sediminis]|tara:strand:+ start:11502 stop:12419 length:918 start_codon:yes stop_codon:yes gene_type:complete
MGRYLLSRLLGGAATLLAVLTFVFLLVRFSGDPVRLMLPDQATAEDVAAMRHALGLDLSLPVQYLTFLQSAVQGDLGISLRQGRPALDIVLERMPATLELALISFSIGFFIAVALAVISEVSGSRRLNTLILWIATARQSVPPFLFGILLVLIFSVKMNVLPAIGRNDWSSYVIPVATIASFEIALYLRLIGSAFEEMRASDWVRTARAKGISRPRLVLGHMLPNALLPVITVAGVNLGVLIGGLVVLETVFNWPGLGRLIIDSVSQRDFPVVQAGVLMIACAFVVINLLVDFIYAALDPRVRHS